MKHTSLPKAHRTFARLVVMLLIPLALAGSSGANEKPGKTPTSYQDWKHSGSVWLLTTPDGADLPATASIEGFSLLVRLHTDFFDFRQAKANGEDLRFSSVTGEPLAYQIEQWDAANGVASIWVRVPIITGNSRQEIKLHWGNADATSESNGQAVFNKSNGYVSVWHMSHPVRDEVGTLPSTDTGTTATAGMIGEARHLPGGKGVFCGDKIPNYPSGASSHSTEAWFRIEQPNATIIGWGNEGGGRGSKVRMLFRSPPHIRIDSDFSDVKSEERLSLGQWIHVIHTYDREDGRIYINGRLDGAAKPLLNIKSPARLWLGGWYNNYDFVGDLDEVRVSQVARSADWIKLQFENQKQHQSVVGPLVQPGDEFSVSQTQFEVLEGQSVTLTAKAGGAQKVIWVLEHPLYKSVRATDRFSYTFKGGRVLRDEYVKLHFKAIYPNELKSQVIAITIKEDIPEPDFTLSAPATWDGRQTIEIVPQIANMAAMRAKGVDQLKFRWAVDDVAVIKEVVPGKLILKRAQGSGTLQVDVAISNGGGWHGTTATIAVKEPSPSKDPWVPRPLTANEQPDDNQFFARDDKNEGMLVYAGTLADAADAVFVRVFADDRLFQTEVGKLTADKTYSLSVKLKPGLIKYRTEFGSKTGDRETVLHTASNLVCGDAFLINGQSNAVATDIGKDDPTFTSDWIRSFGSTAGDPNNSRLNRWGNAVARDRMGGKAEIGYWGLELARRLVESEKIPICILNGAVGGTRIDQHQRNPADPTDVTTIYGRLLWRVQQARLTHGIRGVLWHQGENDQGADGPTGGFGWETYRPLFIDLAAAWKEDYPNIQHYYVFQIWPKACAMGINGSDNQLREVQRTLPSLFSNLSVMSTLGIKPPGGCHFPIEGYAEFARLIGPLIERDHYHRQFDQSITAPNLKRASFTSDKHDELTLEFDQDITWSDTLTSQFHVGGKAGQIASGSAHGHRITLQLKSPSKASKLTYLDSASWNPNNLLYGQNGLAALTFCNVPIETPKVTP